MKKLSLFISILFLLSSCGGRTKSGVTGGLFFSSWKDTISASVDNNVTVSNKGEACAINILGIFAFGDSSVETAKLNGGLKKIAFTDTSYKNILGIYQKGCTIVNGE